MADDQSPSVVSLEPEAQKILSDATANIPADLWEAIAIGVKLIPPTSQVMCSYTDAGTTGMQNAITR